MARTGVFDDVHELLRRHRGRAFTSPEIVEALGYPRRRTKEVSITLAHLASDDSYRKGVERVARGQYAFVTDEMPARFEVVRVRRDGQVLLVDDFGDEWIAKRR